jgi:L-rhamnonate dehydratase
MRGQVGLDFWLMLDCWMSLDTNYAIRLAHGAQAYGLKWLEEALPPDDYWGYAELRRRAPRVCSSPPANTRRPDGIPAFARDGLLRHHPTRRRLVRRDHRVDQDLGSADAHSALVVPHGSSVYSYHFVVTRHNSPFAEFLMMARPPTGSCRCSPRCCSTNRSR